MKKYKFSKTYVAAVLYRYAFLLFVPVLQGILFAKDGRELLFTLYSADLAVLVLIISVAVIRYSRSELRLDGKVCDMRGGVVFKTSEKTILRKRVSLMFSEGIFIRLMGGCRLRIFGGSTYYAAYLRQKDKKDILNNLLPAKPDKIIASGIFRSLIMSLSFSNALTGLLAAVPVIRKASVVLGARQTALILEGASLQGLLKFTGLPPVLSRVSSILFLCWIVGFSTEFFREYGLMLKIYESFFKVQKGLMTKTQAVFSKESVRALIFRQSLIMFVFGFYSGEISLNIRPRRKIHILSAAKSTRCADLQDVFFKEKGKQIFYAQPPESALWGYTYLPILFLAISSLGLIIFSQNLIIKVVLGVFTGIFAVWFLFRTVSLFRSSIAFCENFIEVRYFSGMNFTRTVFKRSEVIKTELSQSIFQRLSGRCNLIFTIGNSKALKVKIKHIKKQTVFETACFFSLWHI